MIEESSHLRQSNTIHESEIVTAHSLKEYEKLLRFNGKLLEGQNVLNFGCGGSFIESDLKKSGISSTVVDVDLKFNPLSFSEKFKRIINKGSQRNFAQTDGKSLPFADSSFDTTLAFFTTYQIPQDKRKQVFRELLRVSNNVFIGPIFSQDYKDLLQLSEEMGYDIIYCRSWNAPLKERPNIENEKDYAAFSRSKPYAFRVQEPKRAAPVLIPVLRESLVLGNIMILRRKN